MHNFDHNKNRIAVMLILSFGIVLFQIIPFGPGETKIAFAGSTLTPTPVQPVDTPIPPATDTPPTATSVPAPTNTPAPPPTSVPSSGGSNTSPSPTPTVLPPPTIPALGDGPSLSSIFIVGFGLLLLILFNTGRLLLLKKPEQQ